MKYPLVEVHWEDATNVAEWADLEEAQACKLDVDFNVRNVGYLIRNDAECVVVAARCTEDSKAVGLCERIPRGMVKKVVVLKKGKVNMANKKQPFSGKKAAPFKKGGGRQQSHPNTAKGTPRKKGK